MLSAMPRTFRTASPTKPMGQNSGSPLMLPPDHPHTRQSFKESKAYQRHTATPSSVEVSSVGVDCLTSGKATRSSRNLTSLFDREKPKGKKDASSSGEGQKVKKSKSATSLSAIFSRPISAKSKGSDEAGRQKDKENQSPAETPIWAQFATQGVAQTTETTRVPLNDKGEGNIIDTPLHNSPSKRKDFRFREQRMPAQRQHPKSRPKSDCLSAAEAQSFLSESVSGFRCSMQFQEQDRGDEARGRKSYSDDQKQNRKESNRQTESNINTKEVTVNRRSSRVMAAVAAFNGRSKELPKEPVKELAALPADPKAIESAFESLLDARNVPQNTRDKMRSLDTSIKADFIKQNRNGSGSASSVESLAVQSGRPNPGKRSKTEDGLVQCSEEKLDSARNGESPKKARPRSRTFTFSKGEGEGSPTKKHKSERFGPHQRSKSGDLNASESTKSLPAGELTRNGSFSLFTKATLFTSPEGYIAYLREVRQPQDVEIGKIHKLRQLLRNETVEWVNQFITIGGMTELVELLYRIMAIEWREEHEDTLLHETLSCLKALSTTSLGLVNLTNIYGSLFPKLIGLLFSEEKKGPSEFTTRTIIIGLLSTYLSSAPMPDAAARAKLLLTYIRDPSKPEAAQLPGFITTMHHPRPYRIWQKEVSDVTKEVFWIFLHQVNIIPYPSIPTESIELTYLNRHFPRPHPPIPTAPYIGGVEWEATTYLTTHLDLLNGLLASLPSRNERNTLRQELRDSGFEKVMGGSLRTCKEKFYGSVHEALSTWVGAAKEDGWDVKGVREGVLPQTAPNSPKKASPVKKGKGEPAPKLEMPKLDFARDDKLKEGDGGWL